MNTSKVTMEMPIGCEVVLRKIENFDKICSFCGKHRAEVKRIIVGSKSSICNECIELSHEILVDEGIVLIEQAGNIPTDSHLR